MIRAAIVLCLLLAAPSLGRAEGLRIEGFAPPTLDGVTALPAEGASDGLVPLRFAAGRDWPALRFAAPAPLDWSGAAALAVPVDNPGDAPVTLLVRLDDDPRADGGDRSLTGLVTLAPHARGRVVIPLDSGPTGMRGRPGAVAAEAGDIPATDMRGTVDAHRIVALHLSGLRSPEARILRLGAPQLRPRGPGPVARGPLADAFGQAIAGDWPEKVSSEADLRRKLAAAAAQTTRLARDAPPAADRFGGVGRPTRATGFFRVEKAGGRWRFVTPDGRPFLSLGVDAVTAANPTIVTGRRDLFAGLPSPGSPLAGALRTDAAGRETFDVGEANLIRAHGAGWKARWNQDLVRRLRAWGFNTLGNWSEPDLGLPGVRFSDVEGASAMVPMPGGRALPDPFDPAFAAVADGVAQAMTAGAPASLLGYFSGNEMPWGRAGDAAGGIAAAVLAQGAASPAKRALVARLSAGDRDAGAWAAAWGLPRMASWEQVLARPLALPGTLPPAARAALAAFQGAFAERYFSTVARAIRRHDPNHLYLGTRFAAAPPEVVAACARWCDVLSFNVYGASPAAEAARWRGFDRPVLIGEFHFGSTDRGSYWPGMVDAGGEARRGPAYAAYLDGALRDPAIVGLHWYQYADEPLTGRPYDGENGHIGLVAVTDVPYAGFVEAVTAANRHALRQFGLGAGGAARTLP